MMDALSALFLSLHPSLSLSLFPSKVLNNGTVFLGSGSEQAEKKVTMATAPVLLSRPSAA